MHATLTDELLSLGAIGFMNTLPLYAGFAIPGVQVTYAPPATLNQLMLTGQVVMSPVSSIWYLQHKESLVLLPGLSVSSYGAVQSVLLASSTQSPPHKVAIPDDSATSVTLLQYYMQHTYPHHSVSYVVYPADQPQQALTCYGHALLIGDRALGWFAQQPDGTHLVDLAGWWVRLTGLPFVFAVWVANRAWLHANAANALRAEAIMQQLITHRDRFYHDVDYRQTVIERGCQVSGLSPVIVTDYLTTALNYNWTDAHKASLDRFEALCHVSDSHGVET
jgi:chorismate dehydratase